MTAASSTVEVDSAENLIRIAAEARPEVIVLENATPDDDVLALIHQLHEHCPDVRTIVLRFDQASGATERSGATMRAQLYKKESAVLAIMPPDSQSGRRSGRRLLSAREEEIIHYVGSALSNRQIATRLGISEGTVKRHLNNIFQKLGAVSRLDAVNKSGNSLLAQISHERAS